MPAKPKSEPARNSLAEPRLDGYTPDTTIDHASVPREGISLPSWHFEEVSLDVPVSVARSALHKEMDRLSRKIATPAGPAANPMQFQMSGNPYAAEMARQFGLMAEANRKEAESLKTQLKELESLSADADIVKWAWFGGHVSYGPAGWFVL